jgi:hypothetical protein
MKMRERIETGPRRWPTIAGENPPAGLPYHHLRLWLRRYAIEIRVWRWL